MRNIFLFIFFIFFNSNTTYCFIDYSFISTASEEEKKNKIIQKSDSIHSDTTTFLSNYSEKDIVSQKTIPSTFPTSKKEHRKVIKQQKKQLRKAIWKSFKEKQKLNKENRKKGIKSPEKKIHWAAYLAIFGVITSLTLFIAVIFLGTMYAIFSYLLSFALLLLPISIISSIIGVSVAINDNNEKYDKAYTLTLSLIGGILSLLILLFIILLLLALSAAFT